MILRTRTRKPQQRTLYTTHWLLDTPTGTDRNNWAAYSKPCSNGRLGLMQAQHAIITLAGPPQLTSTEQWAQIWTGFSTQFPLRNLHWKPATRTSIRTIQSLDANVVSFQSFKEEGASQIPLSILDKPLLNVYVVACEVCLQA